MAVETPIAPAPTAPQTDTKPASEPAAAPVKPYRARNEYPEAYDGLEELDRLQRESSKGDKDSSPKPDKDKSTAKAPEQKQLTPSATETNQPANKPEIKDQKAAPEIKTAEPGPETTEPPDNGEPDPTAKFATAHDLRKDWRRLHRQLQDKDLELTSLKERIKTETPASSAALEENKALKKRNEELETEIRYHDYAKSKEFKDKFEKPYNDAYAEAIQDVQELEVFLPDGQTRPATEHDFARILKADKQEVRKLAKEMFGDAADDVLSARRKLIDLNRTANKESERYREEAAERDRQKALKSAEERENTERLWNKALSTVKEKYQEYFGHIEGDDEYNKALDEGYAIVDKAHAPGLSLEEKVARLAAARHKAGAFKAQVLLNKRLKDRVAELEQVVAGYEKSAPGTGSGESAERKPQGAKEKDGYTSFEEEIDALDVKS